MSYIIQFWLYRIEHYGDKLEDVPPLWYEDVKKEYEKLNKEA